MRCNVCGAPRESGPCRYCKTDYPVHSDITETIYLGYDVADWHLALQQRAKQFDSNFAFQIPRRTRVGRN